MKILIVSATLPPEATATANLLKIIGEHFLEMGHTVHGLTLKESYTDAFEMSVGHMTVYKADHILYSPEVRRCPRDFLHACFRKMESIFNSERKTIYFERVVRKLVQALRNIKAEKYDAIIAVCAYYDAIEAVLRYKNSLHSNVPVFLYQVDPLMNNTAYRYIPEEKVQEAEKHIYESCSAVFTTPIIAKSKLDANWDVQRVIPVEFPGVEQSLNKKIEPKNENEIRCIFTGYLYESIRNAEFTLRLFSQFHDPRIHLYILGKGQEALLNAYALGQLKGRLFCMGHKSSEECGAWINGSDILVNIGNSVINQVPSKIFSYISTGKPILNICKSSACPTIPYLERYPYVRNVIEGAAVSGELAEEVENWILKMAGKSMSYTVIEKEFENCTGNYIAKQMISVMQGYVEG